jgi:hypothetical protein
MGRWSARSDPAGRMISRRGEAGAGDHAPAKRRLLQGLLALHRL